MKKVCVVLLLIMNSFMDAIPNSIPKTVAGVLVVVGTGMASNSKNSVPVFGLSLIAGVAAYRYLYQFTPESRVQEVHDLLETQCKPRVLADVSFEKNDKDKFFETLNYHYCEEIIPLIGARNDLDTLILQVKYADTLIQKAQEDIDQKNDVELYNKSVAVEKRRKTYDTNIREALSLIKQHPNYITDSLAYDALDKSKRQIAAKERQTAAKEKIADAETQKAKAKHKTADAKESSVLLEWLKWLFSLLLKK